MFDSFASNSRLDFVGRWYDRLSGRDKWIETEASALPLHGKTMTLEVGITSSDTSTKQTENTSLGASVQSVSWSLEQSCPSAINHQIRNEITSQTVIAVGNRWCWQS
jgi:hypothetical protein